VSEADQVAESVKAKGEEVILMKKNVRYHVNLKIKFDFLLTWQSTFKSHEELYGPP
jgi:hypothetical protein